MELFDDKPLISIILPVYNISAYLQRCFESLNRQTYDNIEMIIVDDGSTDDSGRMCDAYSEQNSKVRVFHKTNGGLSSARNYGIENARGRYITCIDPDDYVEDDYVEYLYALVKKYSTRMSICQHTTVYDNGHFVRHGSSGDECIGQKECLERMLYHDVIDTSAWAKLYEKELFDTVKYPEGKIFEDIGTTYALMLQCETIAVGYEAKYYYMFHANSIVNSEFNLNKLHLIEMTDKMAADVSKRFPELEDAVLRRRVYARFSTLNQMLNTEEYNEIRAEIIGFIKENRKRILQNRKAPKRDKIAAIILCLSYRLYRTVWLRYRRMIMEK